MRYGMVIDLLRCVGCSSCTVACRAVHATPAGVSFSEVKKYEVGKYPAAKLKFFPMPCMHCKDAPCFTVCPTGATHKRDDGIVWIDEHKCIGCKACIMACPYDRRQFLRKLKSYYGMHALTPYETLKQKGYEEGTVVKCDFCLTRLADGLLPACVETCPAQARFFGNLDDPTSEVSRLVTDHGGIPCRGELGTQPSVYYIRG